MDESKKVIRIPLVGQAFHRPSGNTNYLTNAIDQRFLDCLFKKYQNPSTGDGWVQVAKRPKLISIGQSFTQVFSAVPVTRKVISAFGTPAAYAYLSTNDIALVCDTSTATVTPTGNASSNGRTSRLIEYPNSSGNGSLAFWYYNVNNGRAGTQVYSFDYIASAITEITDGDFPFTTCIGNFVSKDGYLFIMTLDGKIYNSDLNVPTSWMATSYLSTTNSPGTAGRGIALYKDHIIAFTSNTIEFYKNVGNPTGSPLQRDTSATITGYGLSRNRGDDTSCGLQYFEGDSTVYWLNSPLSPSGVGLYKLSNGQPEKISSPEFDTLIGNTNAGYTNIYISGMFSVSGSTYLVLSYADSSGATIIYDLTNKIWSEWIMPAVGYFYPVQTSEFTVDFYSKTDAYTLSTFSTQYDSTLTVQTRLIDFNDNKRKRFHRVKLVGAATSGSVSLSWSDDDYANFTTARTGSFSNNQVSFSNCGQARRRSFRITHSANSPCQFDYLEIEYSECLH